MRKKISYISYLAISVTVACALLLGYSSHKAYAGSCQGSGGTYICSGAANTTTDSFQFIGGLGGAVNVSTIAGFGIDTTTRDAFLADFVAGAIHITADSGITFTDNHTSQITGFFDGISAYNFHSGDVSITTTGTVTGGEYGRGIDAFTTGTNLTIDAQGDVSGNYDGIRTVNFGSGATSIATTGTVTGTTGIGIVAGNYGTDLTIDAQGDVSGYYDGIRATRATNSNFNGDGGALQITTTGTVTGTTHNGISATNYGGTGTTDLTIDAQGDVSGYYHGISARNSNYNSSSTTTNEPRILS